MNKMDRRKFIQKSAAGIAALSVAGSGMASVNVSSPSAVKLDQVKLGNTGLYASRVVMGTGTRGYNKGSNQTRLGMDNFARLAHHGYERGLNLFDMADGYGSHLYVREAVKDLPREKILLSTKIWTYDDGSENNGPVRPAIDRFRQELGTDYIDIVMMHCLTQERWSDKRKHYMDGLSKAKQDGLIKVLGVSCHSWDALVEAAEHPWVEVIMARINPFGSHMDGSLEDINNLLGKARKNGKGIIGMKIFGEGKHVSDEEREQSIKFAVTQGNVDCLTLGLESIAQMDDAIERTMKHVK